MSLCHLKGETQITPQLEGCTQIIPHPPVGFCHLCGQELSSVFLNLCMFPALPVAKWDG